MEKPNRKAEQYKRQLSMLEYYLRGRINQLSIIATNRPAETPACDMAIGELQSVLDLVIPQMREVLP